MGLKLMLRKGIETADKKLLFRKLKLSDSLFTDGFNSFINKPLGAKEEKRK